MFKQVVQNGGFKPLFWLALLCVAVSCLSSAIPAEAHSLTPGSESVLIGGSDCSDFMDGLAVGLGIGVFFGCVWCGAGAIIAKGVALFC